MSMIERGHPEGTCGDCGGENFVWFTSNDVWNDVVDPSEPGSQVFCPVCFVRRASPIVGDEVVAWELRPHYRGAVLVAERDQLRAALEYLYEAWFEGWLDEEKPSFDEWVDTIPRGGED